MVSHIYIYIYMYMYTYTYTYIYITYIFPDLLRVFHSIVQCMCNPTKLRNFHNGLSWQVQNRLGDFNQNGTADTASWMHLTTRLFFWKNCIIRTALGHSSPPGCVGKKKLIWKHVCSVYACLCLKCSESLEIFLCLTFIENHSFEPCQSKLLANAPWYTFASGDLGTYTTTHRGGWLSHFRIFQDTKVDATCFLEVDWVSINVFRGLQCGKNDFGHFGVCRG